MLKVQQLNAELRHAELLAAMEKPLNRATSTPPREVLDQRRKPSGSDGFDAVNIYWQLAYLHTLQGQDEPSESKVSDQKYFAERTMQLSWKRVRWHMQQGATYPSRPKALASAEFDRLT